MKNMKQLNTAQGSSRLMKEANNKTLGFYYVAVCLKEDPGTVRYSGYVPMNSTPILDDDEFNDGVGFQTSEYIHKWKCNILPHTID